MGGIQTFNCRGKPKSNPKRQDSKLQHIHLCPPQFTCLSLLDSSFKQNITPYYFALSALPLLNICVPTQIVVGPHKVEVQACVTPICAEMASACVATWLFQSISCMSSCLMQPAHTAIRSIPVSGRSEFWLRCHLVLALLSPF